MVPLDFFTVMSRQLGVTSYNISTILGTTISNSIFTRIFTSLVTVIFITFSGFLGCTVLYGEPTPNDYLLQQSNYSSHSDSTNRNSNNQNINDRQAPMIEPTSNPSNNNPPINNIVPTFSPNGEPATRTVYAPTTGNTIPTINVPNNNSNNNPTVNPLAVNTTGNTNSFANDSVKPSTTVSITTSHIYNEISDDELSYAKTLSAYGTRFQSNNYSSASEDELFQLLSYYDDCRKNFSDTEDLLAGTELKNSNLNVPANELKTFAKTAFGKSISNNKMLYDDTSKSDYYQLPVENEEYLGSDKHYFDIESTRYNSNKSQVTIKYLYYTDNTDNKKSIEFQAVFKRNENNSKYPFDLISNLPLRGKLTTSSSSYMEYSGSVVDFGDFTLKIPDSWAYEDTGKEIIIYDTETAKLNKDKRSVTLTIFRYNGWDKSLSGSVDSCYGSVNNRFYYYKDGVAFMFHFLKLS